MGPSLAVLAAAAAFAAPTPPPPPLQLPPPHALRVEYLRAPLGVEIGRSPRFSWRLAPPPGERNISQTAYELRICRATFGAGGPGPCYGAGQRIASADSVNVEAPGLALVEDALYSWSVRWWAGGDAPSAWSQNATFGTELRDWSGSAFLGGNYSSNQLRTEFALTGSSPVGRACLYIVGLGNYRAWLSGAQVGNVFRAPPTQFAERLLYDVHDVTSILRQGGVGSRHGLGVALGHARYASQASASHCTGGQVTCDMAMRLVLSIVFEDGSTQRVVSAPGTWQVTAGPTIHDDSCKAQIPP